LSDGQPCGRVKDVYIDDQTWTVRFLKVSLDPLRFGHKQILVTPEQVTSFADEICQLNIGEAELHFCPLDSSYLPVCRQYASFSSPGVRASHQFGREADPHLRSARAIRSYSLHAGAEPAGIAADLLIEVKDWRVQYISVEQVEEKKRVCFLIHPENIERISWSTQRMLVRSLEPVFSQSEVEPIPLEIAVA